MQENLSTNCKVDKYHLLGDVAYPIREHLLTPFTHYGGMTKAKSTFNSRLAAARVQTENAFGLLNQRFRQLRYVEFTAVDKITQLIVRCCFLHNICMDAGDVSVDDLLTVEERRKRREGLALHIRQKRAELEAFGQPQTARDTALRQLS